MAVSYRRRCLILTLLALFLNVQANDKEDDEPAIHLISFNWNEVGLYLIITFFIIFSGLAKVAFHNFHWLSNRVPESW